MSLVRDIVPLLVFAPVQTDKTGDSIAAALGDINAFLTGKGVTADELQPGGQQPGAVAARANFETSGALLGALMQQSVAAPARRLLHAAAGPLPCADRRRARPGGARSAIDPAKLVWVVVGDAVEGRNRSSTRWECRSR